MSASVDVALLGRNTIVREGLQRIISERQFNVVFSAATLAAAPSGAAGKDPAILLILVDDDVAEWTGDSLDDAKLRFPSANIVLLANAFDFQMIRAAFRAGVAGCLVNEISCERLVGLLHLVAMGEKVFPSQLANELVEQAAVSQPSGGTPTIASANLSAREVEILRCLIMGLPNKVISRRLSISEATVKVHVKAVLRKLHLMNRTQAAIWATSRGLRGLDTDDDESGSLHPSMIPANGLGALAAV